MNYKERETTPCIQNGVQICQALDCGDEACVYLYKVELYADAAVVLICEWCSCCAIVRATLPTFHYSHESAMAYIISEALCMSP